MCSCLKPTLMYIKFTNLIKDQTVILWTSAESLLKLQRGLNTLR
jgi:hypothetical protein